MRNNVIVHEIPRGNVFPWKQSRQVKVSDASGDSKVPKHLLLLDPNLVLNVHLCDLILCKEWPWGNNVVTCVSGNERPTFMLTNKYHIMI